MEITGYDNDTLALFTPSVVVPRFLCRVAERWPRFRARLLDDSTQKKVGFSPDQIPSTIPEKGDVFVAADEEMADHWDEHGAVPMSSGESALVLLFAEKLPGIYAYDLVTPEDVKKSEFSAWAVRTLVLCCYE